jgi:AcrR family transcriptional regulator
VAPVLATARYGARGRELRQERARKTFEGLVDAARDLFAERGFDTTQTPDIAARAGVSVGTFYRYFPDKLEVFLEVLGGTLDKSQAMVLREVEPSAMIAGDRRQLVDRALALLVDRITRNPRLEMAFIEMAMREPRVAALKRAIDDTARAELAALIAQVCPPARVRDPVAVAFVVHASVLECALAISGARGIPPIERERGLAALGEMVSRTCGLEA